MWLIENGANVNEVSTSFCVEQSTLKRAILAQQQQVIDCLLSCGRFTQINLKDQSGSTVLHHCATANHGLIKQLVDSGADPTIQNKQGDTPLHCLIRSSGDVDTIQLLCPNAINLKNQKGCSPLHVAGEEKKNDVVALLLRLGADATVRNNDGKLYNEL